MPAIRRIASLIYPDVMSLDVTGPLQVFASANVERQRQGLPAPYELLVLGENEGPVATSAGLRICADAAWADTDVANLDTLLVPGGLGVEAQCGNPALLAWLSAAESQVRRLGSVCSGALLLAAAGVLDGRSATTHWADVDTLRECHPAVHVQGDRLHTYDPSRRDGDDHVFTSAGVTAGIDLALALVEADCGREVAMAVARELVVYLKRPGGQAQYSTLLQSQAADSPLFDELHLWLAEHLGERSLTVEQLAERVRMSPRNFSRVYKQRTGRTPARAIELFRLEAARRLLEHSTQSIEQIARQCGFGNEERMRVTFQRHLSIAPRDYRSRFTREA